ncbi:hypothetical protein [Nevskia soli]|uniref:hypothetical protein n=1 Tax=Nevskia soli TaxID=418856 RepID=UPI0012FC8779|nr:hypothetical protein [Nevskia soli]
MSLFRGENLGCKRAVSGAISWFFEHEEEGIILEDDCLPASSFFGFCQELLKKYRHDHRIWQICGTAFVTDRLNRESSDSYLFSKYGPIWGWATWRRAWAYYNADMIDWPLMSKAPWFESAYEDTSEAKMRLELGNKLYFSKIDTWDYQWGFTKNFQSGLSAIPLSNMIVNIGFGSEATHTTRINLLAPTGKHEMDFPIRHPAFVLADSQHDQLYRKHLVVGSKDARLKNTLKRMIRLLFGRYPL